MISIRASAEDLMQTRFAFSPLWEVVASFRALVDPSRHAIHLPWMVQARERLRGLELGSLRALAQPEGYIPDFLTPPPTTPFPRFSAEIEALRRTPSERVREEVGRLVGQSSSSDRDHELEAYLTDPSGSVERLAQTLVGYYERVIAPY